MLITTILKQQPGKYFRISTKNRNDVWKDHFFRRGQLRTLRQFIIDNSDKDLYWCAHGFSRDRALKEYAEAPRLLYSDLDHVNPRELGPLIPTLAWESSPGRYCGIWMLTDGFMTEDLCRRLNHYIKAGEGGWHFNKVLRIPGTKNYKYISTPRVRWLWNDGKPYSIADIEKHLPKDIELVAANHSDAMRLYRQHEKKLTPYLRKHLIKGRTRVKVGKRSSVLWRIANELLECGLDRDDAFVLIRESPWNKFTGRRNGDERLKIELDKALSGHFRVEDDESPNPQHMGEDDPDEDYDDEEYKFLTKSMAEVEEEDIDWVWFPYIARGELTILEGDPGLGKSYLAQMLSIAVCDGASLPGPKGAQRLSKGKVAYFDLENSAGSVTKPRLRSNGLQNFENFFQEEEPFSVDDDDAMERVFEAVDALKPELVVFDTVNTYIGKADTHKASETQQAFKNFRELAKRYGCAVVVLRHLTKSTKSAAIYRGQGSISFTGLARVVLTVANVPEELLLDDDDSVVIRALSVTKINVTRAPKTLTFTIKEVNERGDSRFEWGDYIDVTSDQLLMAGSPGKPEKASAESSTQLAEQLLVDELKDGPRDKRELVALGEARGISSRTLARVARDMQITTTKVGRCASWALPGQ